MAQSLVAIVQLAGTAEALREQRRAGLRQSLAALRAHIASRTRRAPEL